ncbi:MAG: ATP-binding protein [Chthoniobacteraceae bacterium]
MSRRTGSKRGAASGFRVKLLMAMMLVVMGITAVALYFAERSVASDVQRSLRDEFQSEISYLLGVHEALRAALTERCRVLAKSVRIRAALEESDVEDLYAVATVELRDVLHTKDEPDDETGIHTLRARFFRFVDAHGAVIPPPREPGAAAGEEWETRLAPTGGARAEQQIGYVRATDAEGREVIHEVIATPIVKTDTGEIIGAIVLGFKPVALDGKHASSELKSGLWLEGLLHLPTLADATRTAIGSEVARAISNVSRRTRRNVTVPLDGMPHLIFAQPLNPDSQFPRAYHVCFYSLADALARQRKVQWQILGSAALLLLGGLIASHFVSVGFSAPVERLAVDSAKNLAQRERAEAALVLTEKRYRSIFENAVEGIFLLTPEGRFLSANPALARICGYDSPAQLIAEVSDPAHQLYVKPERFEEFIRCLATEGTVSGFEAEAMRKDGRRIWLSQNGRAVRDTGEGTLTLECTIDDISERKQAGDALLVVNAELEKALDDLKQTQQQIIQQERLRALGQMASGIAHDFNNALVPILGFAELLQLNSAILDDRPTALKYLEIIQTAAQDASSVVARLREFYRSRDHHEKFSAIDLTRLIEQAVSLTRPRWKDQAQAGGATIEVRTELAPIPAIAGDESALREVLTNLVFNAVDAMPGGGTITLRTHQLGGSAVIEVADTGTGMSDEVRQRCLEPFFSTKGDRGTGLGLSMVFGIIQRHSGMIDIRSEPGRGTTFVITLPFAQSSVTTHAGPEPAEAMRSLRVLVVEDEPQVRELLAASLGADGHRVELAAHGIDGLKRFLDGTFDLVLTDKAMPGMSGDQLASAIKQIAPKMPIILLTGFGQFLNPEDYPDVNVVAPKPISIPALREAIATALRAA